jgi:energy-converting hydrogenase B subunit D
VTEALTVFFGLLMAAAALFAVFTKNLLGAVIVSGTVGLLASVLYLLMHAPDVAMTEAAIGSGLTTLVFLLALKRIRTEKEDDDNG